MKGKFCNLYLIERVIIFCCCLKIDKVWVTVALHELSFVVHSFELCPPLNYCGHAESVVFCLW